MADRTSRILTRTVATVVAATTCVVIAAGCGSDDRSDAASTVGAPGSRPAQPAADGRDTTPEAASSDPVDTLPIEQLAGELVMTKLVGPAASPAELEAVRSLQLGGVILFGWNVVDQAQLRRLVRSLDQARAPAARSAGLPTGVLVSVDQEGGAIRNVPFAPPEQTQPQLASETAGSVERVGRQTGEALRAAGVSMDLGPVADLAQSPNRTMAGRAFGSEPAPVAPLVAASVRGLQAGGVSAVAKHFPGFGASTANSDEAVAYVDRTRAQLRQAELVPFRAAIDAGVDAIMVSHGIHRSLGSSLPGTLDAKVATGLLRDELGFEGVAMTDSMNARGFREGWGDTVPRACPAAVDAGIDLLLLTGSLETARLCRARIITAVRDGSLDESRVREAARRVVELRRRVATGPRA